MAPVATVDSVNLALVRGQGNPPGTIARQKMSAAR